MNDEPLPRWLSANPPAWADLDDAERFEVRYLPQLIAVLEAEGIRVTLSNQRRMILSLLRDSEILVPPFPAYGSVLTHGMSPLPWYLGPDWGSA